MPAESPATSPPRQSIKGDIGAAFLLLTRIPVWWHRFETDNPPDFVSALWAYPLVGLVIGALAGLVAYLGGLLSLPPLVTGAVTLLALALLTGAMHEDGLADMADGFGGGGTPERKAEIMHDSRIGSYGVVGLCLSAIARVGLISALLGLFTGWQLIAIIAIITAGARFQVLLMLRLFPLSHFAKLGQMTAKPSLVTILVGLVIGFGPMGWLLGPATTALALGCVILASLWVGRLATRQIGGLTGDVMGASIIIAELALMVAVNQQTIWNIGAW